MPQYYVNTFSPLTPIGQAMQNISLALFGGKTPAELEQEAAHARAYGASAEHSLAGAAKLRAETEALLQAQRDRPVMEQRLRRGTTGMTDPELDVTGKFYGGQAFPDEARQQTIAPGFGVKPSFLTPERERNYRAAEAAIGAAGIGDKTNAEQLAHAQQRYAEQMLMDAITGGTLDPTRVSQASFATGRSTQAPFSVQPDIIGNRLTGQAQMTGLGRAKIGAEGALAKQRGETAGKETKLAEYWGARTTDPEKFRPPAAGSLTLYPVTDETGATIWQPRDVATGKKIGTKPTAAGARTATGRQLAPGDKTLAAMADELARSYGYESVEEAQDAMGAEWHAALAEAVTQWQKSGNAPAAVQAATVKVPKVEQPSWWARTFGGAPSTAVPGVAAAAPAAQPAPVAAPRAAPTGPTQAAADFAKLHAEATAAIAKRPDKAAEIKARFKEMTRGVDYSESY